MTYWILALQVILALRPGPSAPVARMGATTPMGGDLRTYTVEPQLSSLWVVTHRTGVLSFLGHEHVIVPAAWTADLCLADPLPAGAHGTVRIETKSLVIDQDSARALAGLGGGPGPEDRREIQRKMLDENHLNAAEFPEITIDLETAAPSRGGRAPASGSAAIHGITRPIQLAVLFASERPDRVLLAGVLRVRQRDFGIEPESIGGVVKVADEVDLHFTLTARATAKTCGAG